MPHHFQLSPTTRYRIAQLHSDGHDARWIANRLQLPEATIARELERQVDRPQPEIPRPTPAPRQSRWPALDSGCFQSSRPAPGTAYLTSLAAITAGELTWDRHPANPDRQALTAQLTRELDAHLARFGGRRFS